MKKYIAIGLGVAVLLVVMMACGQQAQEPQEKPEQPTQEVQQSESVSPEPTVPPVETEPQDEPKTPENTEPTESEDVKDDQQAETEPIVEPTTKPAATPQENKPQEPPKSPAGQTEPPSNSGSGDDLSEAEKIMRDKFLKDREEAAAQGGVISTDATTNKDFEEIGSQLNQGILTTTPPETSGGETDADIEARKQEFLNGGFQQALEDNGYTTAGTDHQYTQEELDALTNSVQMGG